MTVKAFPKTTPVLTKHISPMVMFLSHESCDRTGKIYELGGGWISQSRMQQSGGLIFEHDYTMQDIAKNLDKIEDFTKYKHS